MLTASSGYVKKRNKIYLRIWRTSERETCYIYRQFHRTGPRLGLYWKLIDQINLMGFFYICFFGPYRDVRDQLKGGAQGGDSIDIFGRP